MPEYAGVGMCDVGCGVPGTDSAAFTSKDFAVWARTYYNLLRDYQTKACEAIGCTCGRKSREKASCCSIWVVTLC